jgi:hypothetical protein
VKLTKQSEHFDHTRSRIMDISHRWEELLDLPGIDVRHKFLDTVNDDDMETAADTETKWQYRWATIRWYVPACSSQTDDQLEEAVVHEYAHVLMAALNGRIKAGSDDHVEHATQSIARALLKAHGA